MRSSLLLKVIVYYLYLSQGWLRVFQAVRSQCVQDMLFTKRCHIQRRWGQVTVARPRQCLWIICLEKLTSVMLWIISKLVTFSSHFSRRPPAAGFTQSHTSSGVPHRIPSPRYLKHRKEFDPKASIKLVYLGIIFKEWKVDHATSIIFP